MMKNFFGSVEEIKFMSSAGSDSGSIATVLNLEEKVSNLRNRVFSLKKSVGI